MKKYVDLTTEDHAALAQQSMEVLAQWWCDLNSWEWPDDLPEPESEEFVAGGRRQQLMRWIEGSIGHRVISRCWNKGMTDEEHNDFWIGTWCGNTAAKQRHDKRVMDKIKAKLACD